MHTEFCPARYFEAAELPYSTGAPQVFALRHASGLIYLGEAVRVSLASSSVMTSAYLMEIEKIGILSERTSAKSSCVGLMTVDATGTLIKFYQLVGLLRTALIDQIV